jgi:hypothetical protein
LHHAFGFQEIARYTEADKIHLVDSTAPKTSKVIAGSFSSEKTNEKVRLKPDTTYN